MYFVTLAPAFLTRLSDADFDPVAQNVAFELGICGELQNAEFERAMLRERTKIGLEAARREERIGGRRPRLTPQQQSEIRKMDSKGQKTAADAARLFKVPPATVSRLLARAYAR